MKIYHEAIALIASFTLLQLAPVQVLADQSQDTESANAGPSPGAGAAINAYDAGRRAPYTTPGFNFLQSESYRAGSGNFHMGAVIQLNRNGGSGNRNALDVQVNSSAAAIGEMIVGAQMNSNLTGGSGSAFGANPYAYAASSVAATAEVVGAEMNTDVENARVARKVGVQIVDVARSSGGGALFDAGLIVGKQPGAKGYRNGIQFGFSSAGGLQPNGTLITAPYRFTVLNGIDFSQLQFTDSALKSKGFRVDPSGAVLAHAVGVSGQLNSHYWINSGAYSGWNYSGSQGETDFINSSGGSGGFNFYEVPSNLSATPHLIAEITSTGLNSTAIGVTTPSTGVFTKITSTGSGAMPLYSISGVPVNAPHMVRGSATLLFGRANVTFKGAAAYTSATSYTCTANDTTSMATVKIGQASGTSILLIGIGTDTVQFICSGN